jgi:LemA protein
VSAASGLLKKPLGLLLVLIIILVPVFFLIWVGAAFNGLVARDQSVQAQCAQVENQYIRKLDLIPQLVNVTSTYTQFEKGVLENITRLRSDWGNASVGSARGNITNQIDNLLVQVRATYEAYPELASIGIVRDLFDELAGTENRIAFERGVYIDEVRGYNTKVRSFPDNIVAGWFGFGQHDLNRDPVRDGCDF